MAKLLILLALAVSGAVAGITQDFLREIRQYHGDSPHADQFLLCSDMPGLRTLEVNFFSVSNAAEFLNGAKPNLQEMTTVVFDETRSKANCSANIVDMSINFGQNRFWSSKSGDLNQRVNTANVPFQRIGHALCDGVVGGECVPSLVEQGEGYLKEGTINELLINGIDLTHFRNVIAANPTIKGDLPELEEDRFAILPQLHFPKKLTLSSDDDTYGKIMLMDDQNEMLWWKTESSSSICSQFAGTTGELFNQVTEESILHYYSDDLCASQILQFDSVDNTFGFPALKFVSYPGGLGGSCFSTSANLPSGAIDVKGCQRGLPLVMSYPHFYEGDSSYNDKLEGMRPDETRHQSYFIIEPVTGMLVESNQRFQLNVNLQKFNQDDNLEGQAMPDTILPLYWFNKKYILDDTHINAIRAMLTNPSNPTNPTTSSTPTTAAASEELFSGEQFWTVQQKLNDISSKLNVVTGVVFTFVVLAVIILAAFSFMQFWQNKKLLNRDHVLPKYIDQYEAKP